MSSLFLLGSAGRVQAAAVDESFFVNTASLQSQSGAIDLEFNPGQVGSTQSANASVTQFIGPAIDGSHSASYLGHVSGALPGALTFDNGAQLNDAFTPVKFGAWLSFTVTMSGPAVSNPDSNASDGSVFELAFDSTNGTTPLMTRDGIIATVDLAPGTGIATSRSFTPEASVTPADAVPEPATFLPACSAALLLLSRLLFRRAK